jgi:hypothetical protein
MASNIDTTFELTLDCFNDAFSGGNCNAEIARILRVAADRIENGTTMARCHDANGNNVGAFEVVQ